MGGMLSVCMWQNGSWCYRHRNKGAIGLQDLGGGLAINLNYKKWKLQKASSHSKARHTRALNGFRNLSLILEEKESDKVFIGGVVN